LLVGTDAMNTGVVPGVSVHDELADLVTAGLTPPQALRAATINAADFLGPSARGGLVAVGRTADLFLLDANPLDDVANSRRIAGVMLRGRWLNRTALKGLLDEIRSPER
jgi:imidazolonepropionase-like amidohydrolase